MTRPPSGLRRCPCTSGLIWDDCCGPLVSRDRKPPTAEALMRSRFSAFAVGDADYLLYSWHPRTRPDVVNLDAAMRWYRLDIESTLHGSLFDSVGEVEFTAFYRIKGSSSGTLHERSRFEKHEGRWVYVDGEVASD